MMPLHRALAVATALTASAAAQQVKLPSSLAEGTVVKVFGASGLSSIRPYLSGVVVSAEGHVLTFDRAAVQKGKTRVVLDDGSVHVAELLPTDIGTGARLMKIDISGLKQPLRPARLLGGSADDRPTPGSACWSLGNAYRLAEYDEWPTVCRGVVTTRLEAQFPAPREKDPKLDLLVTDAWIHPGHEGGGLFDREGRLIGLGLGPVRIERTATWVSGALPIDVLLPYLARYVPGVEAPKETAPNDTEKPAAEPVVGYHGIRLFDPSGDGSGTPFIDRTERGSPARRARLRSDDLILQVGETTVRNCQAFETAMKRYRPGAKVMLRIEREGSIKQFTIELTEPKEKR